jgi:hypothetical protein
MKLADAARAKLHVVASLSLLAWFCSTAIAEPAPEKKSPQLPTAEEARGCAEVLHESMHAALQAIHHEYFGDEEKVTIPAVTLSKVFRQLARRQQIELRWLVVNAQAMNVDNEPRDAFEKQAVTALAAGADHLEAIEPGRYRRVGAILLASECLKCHLPSRTGINQRVAGLSIAIPIREFGSGEKSPVEPGS